MPANDECPTQANGIQNSPGVPLNGNKNGAGKNEAAKDESLAATALRLAEARGLEVFCDELRTPCARLPDDPTEPFWPLYHQRVKAWFAAAVHADLGAFVSDKELLPTLRVLEDQAWRAPRRPPSSDPTWQQIERDPIALALITYANEHGEFIGLTRDLFQRLRQPYIQTRLQAACLSHKFPINTQVFSRRLKLVKHALSMIGLDVSAEHKENGSYATVRMRRPAFVPEPDAIPVIPSVGVSSGKQQRNTDFGLTDGTDANRTPSPVSEENFEAILGEIKAIREGQP